MRASNNAVTYLAGDHLGSVSVATTQSGGLASPVTEYTPWGALRTGGIAQTTLSYTGQRRDDTGLLYYHARYYDPTLGRFVSPDSVVPGADALNATAGGSGAGPANPQQLNRYSYVANNPVNRTDPTGHLGECNSDTHDCGGEGSGPGGSTEGASSGGPPTGEAKASAAEAETASEASAAEAEAQAAANSSVASRSDGGTGANYDSANGRGLYVLRDNDGVVRYVGQGDAPARGVAHLLDAEKRGLVQDILANNKLTKAEARGLEQALIDHFGGAKSSSTYTGQLLNRINGIAPGRIDVRATAYRAAAQRLFHEILQLLR